jgi:minor extracellular serine protease Vpr
MRPSLLNWLCVSAAAVLAACGGGGGSSEADPVRQATAAQQSRSQATHAAVAVSGTAVDARLRNASGQVDVWVQLDQHSLARTRATIASTTGVKRVRPVAMAGGARATESSAVLSALASQRASLVAQQAQVGQRLAALGGRELGRVKVAHNAIAVRIDASQLKAVAALAGVKAVRPVTHPKLDLSETVPYVGGTAVQATGVDGTGVRVAVLDSGIDYTHKNISGPGTAEAYTAAWGTSTSDPRNTTRDGLFPTAKVVDGFDFVGEAWPSGDRTEDPDPIDFEGHGTHVADIIAGKSLDGTHVGMAPGASLLAVKVCSAVSSSCNGVALLKGVDFSLDPNGDGDFSDAVDVMNLSLGSSYGQIEDDLSQALSNAVDLGVVVVASAGNSADRPYITGSPSIAAGVIGVAQTQTPSAKVFPVVVNSPAAIAGSYTNTAALEWAPVGEGATGDIKTALQAGAANNLACTPLPPGSLTGKIALIDRGSCAVSIKVDNAAKAGATGVLVALVAPGDAITFSFGGGTTFVPSLVIQQSLGNSIKGQLNGGAVVNVSFSPASSIPLVGSMVGSSSRGPAYGTHLIKPEIGAPGASLSAEAGTGDGQTVFGGTSGAAPMVAGAAVLMVQALPTAPVMQIKAMLMNSAETTVYTNPAVLPGGLAPITRIGAGELRVNRAVALTSFAWDQQALSATLGFGAHEVDRTITLRRTLTVQNVGSSAKSFTVTPGFRYADDEASGAVSVSAPASVNVPAGGSRNITVRMTIDPSKLPEWVMNGGSNGGNGALLNTVEIDGYLTLTAGSEKLSVPWHVLPRKAARTVAQAGSQRSSEGPLLNNRGVSDGGYDLFSLTGSSPQLPPDSLPSPGDNFAIVDLRSTGARYLPEDVCGVAGGCVEFAISTYGRRSHPNYPATFEVGVDNNADGVEDFVVFNTELTGFAATGQNVVAVRPATSSTGTIFFFADADLNSGNMIFTVPLSALGGAMGSTLGFNVRAFDNYFTGELTDAINGMRFTPGASRFSAPADGLPFGVVPGQSSTRVPYATARVPRSASTETGLLMMYRTNAASESQELLIR